MSHDPPKTGKQPMRLGKYEVLGRIGRGGMGTVYRAIDTDLQRLVALKIMAPELAAKPVMLERFRREARSAAKLRHDNIVAIYDFGEHEGSYFLALEFVDGKDLQHVITRKGKLDPALAREILIQASRALDHAHRQGIVHRDIKPSNFLIAKVGRKLQVKLTDMGLARIVGDEEAKLTRDHSTVGTVDYMAPEQAHNSRAADIRSDIYSLGCTFYHMLAGHAPHPRGSIPERIIAHLKIDPPDIRNLNDQVSPDLVRILKKMLAKKPIDRYQTPAELLSDLETETVGLAPLEEKAVAQMDEETKNGRGDADKPATTTPAARPPSGERDKHWLLDQEEEAEPPARERKRPARVRGEDEQEEEETEAEEKETEAEDEEDEKEAAPPKRPAWALYGGVVAALGVAAVVAVLATRPTDDEKPKGPPKPTTIPPGPHVEKKGPLPIVNKEPEAFVGPPLPVYPPLYKPTLPLDKAKLRDEFLGKEALFPEAPEDAPVIAWRRAAETDQARTFAAALARVPDGAAAVIEIHDNGPLWLPATTLGRRTLHIRAAPGYRPLLAWDLAATLKDKAKGPPHWFHCQSGRLVLEGVDLVMKWEDGAPPESASLFRLENASLHARDCTISLSGKQATQLSVFHATSAEPTMLHLSRCLVRGPELRPVIAEGKVDVTLEGSLLAGAGSPLVQIVNRGADQTVLRLVRSSLVAMNNAIVWKLEPEKKGVPQLKVLAWDALIARSELATPQGDMVLLSGPAEAGMLRWRGVNCLYAGWKQLLVAPDRKIGSGSIAGWRSLFGIHEGEEELAEPWPPRIAGDPGELPLEFFRTHGTSAHFAATSGRGSLGCEVAVLAPGPADWPLRTYERYPVVAPPLVEDTGVPTITASADSVYHGEKLDLTKVDLGLHLETVLKSRKPAAKVILHLTGAGKVPTSPVKVRGLRHLVLYFEQTAKGKEEPLTLGIQPKSFGKAEALIDVEGATLEMVNGRIYFPDSRSALMPPYMVLVRDGELRLRGCVFQGPFDRAPDSFKGLIRWELPSPAAEGEGRDAEKPLTLVVQDCVFQSHRRLLEIEGGHAVARFKNNLFYAGEDAIHLVPAAIRRPRLFMLLENNTAAIRKRFLTIATDPDAPPLLEPLVIHATENYFLDPFAAEPRQATLLSLPAGDLSQGHLLWQGRANAMEEGRWASLWSEGAGPGKVVAADWQAWWGSLGEQSWKKVEPAAAAKAFAVEAPQFERLIPPPPYRLGVGAPPFGADLLRLGLVRKKG